MHVRQLAGIADALFQVALIEGISNADELFAEKVRELRDAGKPFTLEQALLIKFTYQAMLIAASAHLYDKPQQKGENHNGQDQN